MSSQTPKAPKKAKAHTAHQCERPQNRHLTPWPPGVSGNPAGRPSAGAAVKEWFNQMTDWTLEQLEAVVKDPKASSAKVTAAKQWLNAREGNGSSVDRIFDRTEGKPEQPISHGGTVELRNCTTDELRTIRDILADASRRSGQPEPGRN